MNTEIFMGEEKQLNVSFWMMSILKTETGSEIKCPLNSYFNVFPPQNELNVNVNRNRNWTVNMWSVRTTANVGVCVCVLYVCTCVSRGLTQSEYNVEWWQSVTDQ